MTGKRYLLLGFLLFVSASCFCGSKYKLTFKINNFNNSTILLINYYGDKNYVIDTAYLKNGLYVFEGDSLLASGMYIIATQSKSEIMSFFVDDNNQQFSCSLSIPLSINNVSFKKSSINTDYYTYMNFIALKQVEVTPYRDRLKSTDQKSKLFSELQGQIDAIDNEVSNYTNNIIERNKDNVLSLYLMTNLRIMPIKSIQDIYSYYRSEYWKHFAIADVRLLHTAGYTDKINYYLEQLTIPLADSINKSIDEIILKVEDTPEVLHYVLWYLSSKYEMSKIMGQDAVFVHIIDKYYSSGFNTWTDKNTIDAYINKTNGMRKVLIGNKAANISLYDTSMNIKSLYDINAKYTIVLFWDDDCASCRAELPKIIKFYNNDKDKFNMEIFGVYVGESMAAMKTYIKENYIRWPNVNGMMLSEGDTDYRVIYDVSETPALFILDKNKKIIGKQLIIEDLEKFIEWNERK